MWRAIAKRSLTSFSRRTIYNDLNRYKNRELNPTAPPETASNVNVAKVHPLQFPKIIIGENDNVPFNGVPLPLKFSRPFQMTTLDNGVRVCTEYWPAKSAAVGVVIGAGSRHETLQTSGTAHFMEHLHFKVSFLPVYFHSIGNYKTNQTPAGN